MLITFLKRNYKKHTPPLINITYHSSVPNRSDWTRFERTNLHQLFIQDSGHLALSVRLDFLEKKRRKTLITFPKVKTKQKKRMDLN